MWLLFGVLVYTCCFRIRTAPRQDVNMSYITSPLTQSPDIVTDYGSPSTAHTMTDSNAYANLEEVYNKL